MAAASWKASVLSLIGLAGVATLLVACAGPAAPAPTPKAAIPSPVAAVPPKVEAPKPEVKVVGTPTDPKFKYGGRFVYGTHKDFKALSDFDPHRVPPGTSGGVLRRTTAIYNGIFEWPNHPYGPTAGLLCDLCESWKQLDPVTYEIKFRKGVKWQNLPPVNGREFTVDDVVYSLKRMGTKDPTYHENDKVDDIKTMETPDKYTLKITLKEPSPIFLPLLGDPFAAIIPKEIVDDKGKVTYPVGTGPFMLKDAKDFEPKSRELMVKNPDYWRKNEGLPYLDEVEVITIPDHDARFDALMAGQIHEGHQNISEDMARTAEKNPKFVVGKAVRDAGTGSSFNLNPPQKPVDDIKVRRAMHLATDRQEMLQTLYKGNAFIYRFVGPAYGDYATPQEEVVKRPGWRQPKDQDIADAKKLLAEAGLATGFKLPTMVSKSVDNEKFAIILKEQMRKYLNIDLALEVMEMGVSDQRVIDRQFVFGVTSASMADGLIDPTWNLRHWLTGADPSDNEAGYSNPEYDKLYEQLYRETDKAKRIKLVRQMEDILERDIPGISFGVNYRYRVWPKLVHGLVEESGAGDTGRWVRQVWLECGSAKGCP